MMLPLALLAVLLLAAPISALDMKQVYYESELEIYLHVRARVLFLNGEIIRPAHGDAVRRHRLL
jgi:hypothetical protein